MAARDILVACSGSAAGYQVRPEPVRVNYGATSLTPEAQPAQPTVLPLGIPRVVASETHRQKAIRGHDGTTYGVIPKEVPLPLVIHQGSTPILGSDVLWSASVGACESCGPPSVGEEREATIGEKAALYPVVGIE